MRTFILIALAIGCRRPVQHAPVRADAAVSDAAVDAAPDAAPDAPSVRLATEPHNPPTFMLPRNLVCERVALMNPDATCIPEMTGEGELHTHSARVTVGGVTHACAINATAPLGFECAELKPTIGGD